MKVRALRGVCIGVERHLDAGDVEDLDPATGQFLISIGAVEEVKEKPVKAKPAEPASDANSKSAPADGTKEK